MRKLLPFLAVLPFLGGCYWVPINAYHMSQGPITDTDWIQDASDKELCEWYFEPRRRSEAMKKEILDRGIASEDGLKKATYRIHDPERQRHLARGMTKCEVWAALSMTSYSVDVWEANGTKVERWKFHNTRAKLVFEDGRLNRIVGFHDWIVDSEK